MEAFWSIMLLYTYVRKKWLMWERKAILLLPYCLLLKLSKEKRLANACHLQKWGNLVFDGRQVLYCECSLRKFTYMTTVPKQLQFSYTGFEKK